MDLDVVLPNESPSMPVGALRDLAREAEDLGFATAWLPDHVLPPGPYGPEFGGVLEPLVTIGHLAAVTERLRFGTSVLVAPLRNPFVLAKQARRCRSSPAGGSCSGSVPAGAGRSSTPSAPTTRTAAPSPRTCSRCCGTCSPAVVRPTPAAGSPTSRG